jgi:hypothetical protein
MAVRPWAPLAAAGVSLLVLAVVVGVNVGGAAPRELGSNLVRPLSFDVVLDGREEVCQPVEDIPAGTAGLELRIGTDGRPGPPLRSRIKASGGLVATGQLAAGWHEGDVVAPVSEVLRGRDAASVCVRNGGRAPIALAGHSLGSAEHASVDGRLVASNIRVAYVRADGGSWLSRAGFVAERVGSTRVAFPGAATFWIWLALALAVLGGAVAVVLRQERG